MLRGALLAAVVLASSSAASARDLLPLRRGIYVEAGVPCLCWSNATTMSYRGDRNGINIAKRSCTILAMRKRGRTYLLHRQCRDRTAYKDSGIFEDDVTVHVRDASSFDYREIGSGTYRFCAARVELLEPRLSSTQC